MLQLVAYFYHESTAILATRPVHVYTYINIYIYIYVDFLNQHKNTLSLTKLDSPFNLTDSACISNVVFQMSFKFQL